jgi:hypothetical protein
VTVCECFYYLARALRDFPGADETVKIVLADKVEILDGRFLQDGLTTTTHFRSDLWETVQECLSLLTNKDFKQTHWPFKDARRLLKETNEMVEQDLFKRSPTAAGSELDSKKHRIPGSDIWVIESHEGNDLEFDRSHRGIVFKKGNEPDTEELPKNIVLKSDQSTSAHVNTSSMVFVVAGLVALLGLTLHFRKMQ